VTKTDELKRVRDEVVALAEGELATLRRAEGYLPVIGEGSHDAKIMFVGEAPGANEAKTGRPFVGAAGKVLEKLLQSVGIERKDVYITNIVKDRPPGNRDPFPDEIALYAPFLDRQIKAIKPKVIATLGRFSMQWVMNRYGLEWELAPISVLHGRVLDLPSEALAELGTEEPIKVVPLFHPAAAIYNRELVATLEEDFKVLAKI
jgi:DNA polymerase